VSVLRLQSLRPFAKAFEHVGGPPELALVLSGLVSACEGLSLRVAGPWIHRERGPSG
jgi:hypothetical protein